MNDPGEQSRFDETCSRCGAAVDDSWLVCAWCGGQLSAPAELTSGVLLEGRFFIESVLGRGGFGITYRARDQRLERTVAIKELFPPAAVRHGTRVLVEPREREAFTAARVRFQREATALAQFSHPGIVRIYEVFEAHNTVYLVMELLDGASLHTVLTKRVNRLGVDDVLDATLRIGDALAAVHQAGIIHRDVNPANVVLDHAGRIVLIDFGLAHSFQEQTASLLTRAVTPGFAPPEQYLGTSDIGPSCDVYALAATTYKLLTGVTPTSCLERQAGTELTAPHTLRDDIPSMVSQAILDGLELDASHRPESARAFLDRLGMHGRQPGLRAMLSLATPVVVADGRAPRHEPQVGAHPVAINRAAVVAPVADLHPARSVDFGDDATQAEGLAMLGPAVGLTDAVDVSSTSSIPHQVLNYTNAALPRDHHTGGNASGGDDEFAAVLPRIGSSAPNRGWVTIPVGISLLALASAMPTLAGLVVALVVIPAVATYADVIAHRRRQFYGITQRGWHRVNTITIAPVLALRNVGAALIPATPWAAVLSLGIFAADAIGSTPSVHALHDAIIRVFGIAAMMCLMLPLRHARHLLKIDQGLDQCASWATEHSGKPTTRTVVVWISALCIAVLGIWLSPDFWPISF